MAKDRPAVQIIIAIIGVSGALGAAWINHRNSALPPESPPLSVHSDPGVSNDPTKAMLRHFAIKFSTDRQGQRLQGLRFAGGQVRVVCKGLRRRPSVQDVRLYSARPWRSECPLLVKGEHSSGTISAGICVRRQDPVRRQVCRHRSARR